MHPDDNVERLDLHARDQRTRAPQSGCIGDTRVTFNIGMNITKSFFGKDYIIIDLFNYHVSLHKN